MASDNFGTIAIDSLVAEYDARFKACFKTLDILVPSIDDIESNNNIGAAAGQLNLPTIDHVSASKLSTPEQDTHVDPTDVLSVFPGSPLEHNNNNITC